MRLGLSRRSTVREIFFSSPLRFSLSVSSSFSLLSLSYLTVVLAHSLCRCRIDRICSVLSWHYSSIQFSTPLHISNIYYLFFSRAHTLTFSQHALLILIYDKPSNTSCFLYLRTRTLREETDSRPIIRLADHKSRNPSGDISTRTIWTEHSRTKGYRIRSLVLSQSTVYQFTVECDRASRCFVQCP